MHLAGFNYKHISICTVLWMSNSNVKCSIVIICEIIVLLLVIIQNKKYKTKIKFITLFTKVRHVSLSWFRLTLYLLTWRILLAPNNASKGQVGFNSAFKGLIHYALSHCFCWRSNLILSQLLLGNDTRCYRLTSLWTSPHQYKGAYCGLPVNFAERQQVVA
jgi:hypothetical protein